MAVGAGGALIPGENGLGRLGSSRGAFSVGCAGGADVGDDVVVVVVVVDVCDGPSFSSPPHAVSAPIEMTAAIPREAATRRVNRPDFMMQSYSSHGKTIS
jgi:hypothetical protein